MHKQVCKRIHQRIGQLGLPDIGAYRGYLQAHGTEWRALDGLCRVTVSRFYRDRGVMEHLGAEVLPELARRALARGQTALHCWSAGCASGEEAYSLVLLWEHAGGTPALPIHVTATDIDAHLLQRAAIACYPFSSVRALPEPWRQAAFSHTQDGYCLAEHLRRGVNFATQDIRDGAPAERFHLVLCRNMAFTYFDPTLQLAVLETIRAALHEGGALVLGGHELLPNGSRGFSPWLPRLPIYRKTG